MTSGAGQVLEALRRGRGAALSGESLSRSLGVSRAQIWKHVEALRGLGYEIEGAPGGGYRWVASPDRLYAEEVQPLLSTRWLARTYRWLDSTDSTNRVAMALAREGAEHGTTVVAEAQSAGRGRLGRAFFSPAYLNLYTSIVLRPLLDTAEAPTTILAAAVAVAEAVGDELRDPEAVEIKWPNDVLIDGLKTSGILMEMGSEATRVSFLVLGIGVNLNVSREALPSEFRRLATSVAAQRGEPVDRVAFAARLYDKLEAVLDLHGREGFEGIRPRFETHFRMCGRRVRVVDVGGGDLEGAAAGIDRDGALLVLKDDGATERVVAGDVTLAKESPA